MTPAKLTKHWYNILQKDGFEDIEYSDMFHLKVYSHRYHKFCKETPIYYFIKQDYYYYASHFAENHAFKSHTERTIWHMHAQGIGCRDIADSLGYVEDMKPNKDNINKIIRDLKPKFLEYWKTQIEDNFNDMCQYGIENKPKISGCYSWTELK